MMCLPKLDFGRVLLSIWVTKGVTLQVNTPLLPKSGDATDHQHQRRRLHPCAGKSVVKGVTTLDEGCVPFFVGV